MVRLVLPALLLGATALAQSPGTWTMNVTTHSTGAPGSGCIILAQIATLSAPHTITAMKPICPPTAPNPTQQGGEVVPWPMSADGDGASSDMAIYGNLPGGDGETWKPGCVMMVTQRQVTYLLGRSLEWVSDIGQVNDLTGKGYLLDPVTFFRMSCQSNHPYMAGNINLPSPNVYKADNSIWWTSITVDGLGEGEVPPAQAPSSSAVIEGSASETSPLSSEGPASTTSFRFIDTSSSETPPVETPQSPPTSPSTSMEETSSIVLEQPTEPALTDILPTESVRPEVPQSITDQPLLSSTILVGIESQQSTLAESTSRSSSTSVSTVEPAKPTALIESSQINISDASNSVEYTAPTSNLPTSAIPGATDASPTEVAVPSQTSPAAAAEPTTRPVLGDSTTSMSVDTFITSDSSMLAEAGSKTVSQVSLITVVNETTAPAVTTGDGAAETASPSPDIEPTTIMSSSVSSSDSDAMPSANATFESGQTDAATPTLQIPNKIPNLGASSDVSSDPTINIDSSTTESTSAGGTTAFLPQDSSVPNSASITQGKESPSTSDVGKPRVTTSRSGQESGVEADNSVDVTSPSSTIESTTGPEITLEPVQKGKMTAITSQITNVATGIAGSTSSSDNTGSPAIPSNTGSSSSSLSSSSPASRSSSYTSSSSTSEEVASSYPNGANLSSQQSQQPSGAVVSSDTVPKEPAIVTTALRPISSTIDTAIIPQAEATKDGNVLLPTDSVLRISSTVYVNETHPTTSVVCCSENLSVSERDLTTVTVVSTQTCIPCTSSTSSSSQVSLQTNDNVEPTIANKLEAGSVLTSDLPSNDQEENIPSATSSLALPIETPASSSDIDSTVVPSTRPQTEAANTSDITPSSTALSSSSSSSSVAESQIELSSLPQSSQSTFGPMPSPSTNSLPASTSPPSEASPSPTTSPFDVPVFDPASPFRELGFFPFSSSLKLKQRQGGRQGRGGNRGGGNNHQGGWGRPANGPPADIAGVGIEAPYIESAATDAAWAEPAAAAASTEQASVSAADVTSVPPQPSVSEFNYDSTYDQEPVSIQGGEHASSTWPEVTPKTGQYASETSASTIDRETVASATSVRTSATSERAASASTRSAVSATPRVTTTTNPSSSIGFSNAANGTDETNGNDDGEDEGEDGDPTISMNDSNTDSTGSSQISSLNGQATSSSSSIITKPTSGSSLAGKDTFSVEVSSTGDSIGSSGTADESSSQGSLTSSNTPSTFVSLQASITEHTSISSSSSSALSATSIRTDEATRAATSEPTSSGSQEAEAELSSISSSSSSAILSTPLSSSSALPLLPSSQSISETMSQHTTDGAEVNSIVSPSPSAGRSTTTPSSSSSSPSMTSDRTVLTTSSPISTSQSSSITIEAIGEPSPTTTSVQSTIETTSSTTTSSTTTQPSPSPPPASEPSSTAFSSSQEKTTEQPIPSTVEEPSPEPTTSPTTSSQDSTTDEPPPSTTEQAAESTSPESASSSFQETSLEQPPPSSSQGSPTMPSLEQPSSSNPVFTNAGVTIGQFLTSLLSTQDNPSADAANGGDDVTTIGQFTPSGDIPGLAQATQTLAVIRRPGEPLQAKATSATMRSNRRRSRSRRRGDRP